MKWFGGSREASKRERNGKGKRTIPSWPESAHKTKKNTSSRNGGRTLRLNKGVRRRRFGLENTVSASFHVLT